jgi:anti-anti-sigma factor
MSQLPHEEPLIGDPPRADEVRDAALAGQGAESVGGALPVDDATVVQPALAGDWTIYRAAELRSVLADRVAAGDTEFDLSGIGEFDCAGLQLLLALRRSVARRGAHARLVNMPDAVREACATGGFGGALAPDEEMEAS